MNGSQSKAGTEGVYDSLIDEDPEVIERVAKSKAEGELQALQEMALYAVEEQFPPLMELAQQRIAQIRKPDVLRLLVKQIYKAPDEKTARWVLDTIAA